MISVFIFFTSVALHLTSVLIGPTADYAVWLKSDHFAFLYLCDMGLMM